MTMTDIVKRLHYIHTHRYDTVEVQDGNTVKLVLAADFYRFEEHLLDKELDAWRTKVSNEGDEEPLFTSDEITRASE